MKLRTKAPLLALEPGQVVTLDDAKGTRIVARTGLVWVTEEGDNRDHVVGPGDALIVAHSGRTVVQALKSAWVSLTEAMVAANDPAPDDMAQEWPGDAIARMRARQLPYY
jgi:hypothetical protein